MINRSIAKIIPIALVIVGLALVAGCTRPMASSAPPTATLGPTAAEPTATVAPIPTLPAATAPADGPSPATAVPATPGASESNQHSD
jgi:hypothetical protein